MFESERRDLAHVMRWGILRVLRRQSIAEHSYFVCCYGLKFAELLHWSGDRASLATYLLRHDEAEVVESDIPRPIKRLTGYDSARIDPLVELRFGPVPQVSEEMRALRISADLLDECMYLAGEMAMGNATVRPVLYLCLKELQASIARLPGEASVLVDLDASLEQRIYEEMRAEKNLDGLVNDRTAT